MRKAVGFEPQIALLVGFCGGGGIRTHASLTAQGFSKPSQWTGLCDASNLCNYTSSVCN